MSKATVAKKIISTKVVALATKTFEELSKSRSTPKTTKQINRSAKKLVKMIQTLIKKSEKKKARLAKALAKKKAKVANSRRKVQKTSKPIKTSRKPKKVPAN